MGTKLLNVRMGNGIVLNLPKGIPYTLNIKLIIGHFLQRNQMLWKVAILHIDDDGKSINKRDKYSF